MRTLLLGDLRRTWSWGK